MGIIGGGISITIRVATKSGRNNGRHLTKWAEAILRLFQQHHIPQEQTLPSSLTLPVPSLTRNSSRNRGVFLCHLCLTGIGRILIDVNGCANFAALLEGRRPMRGNWLTQSIEGFARLTLLDLLT
jgi:hypothetical protein